MAISDSTSPSIVPPAAGELRSKVTWVVSGSEVKRNGFTIKENYAPSLERLEVSELQAVMIFPTHTGYILPESGVVAFPPWLHPPWVRGGSIPSLATSSLSQGW